MNNYQPRAPHPGRTAVEPCHTTVHATSCNTQSTPGEGLGVDLAGGAAPPPGGKLQDGQLLLLRPANEVSGLAAVRGVVAGQPALEVALPGTGQGEVVGGEPVEQDDGGFDASSGADDLSMGGVRAAQPVAKPPQHMPDGVAVQQLLLVGVGSGGDRLADPALQPDQMLVPGGQCPDGDQNGAQVLDRFACGQLIQGAVGDFRAGVEVLQNRRGGASVEPGRHGGG